MFRYPSRAAWLASAALVISGVGIASSVTHAQAPIIDGVQPVARGNAYPATGGAAGASGQVELYRQLQSLQEEVMQLRGLVEEQSHQLQELRQQSLDRYMDLDRRLIGGAAAVPPAAAPAAGAPPLATGIEPINAQQPPQAPASAASATAAAPAQAAPAGEQDAYKQAYAKLKGQQYTVAIQSFDAFIKDYPSSELIPNAHYWLGELHLVESPQNLNAADQSFAKLLSDFPQHAKAPDALYKQGKIAFMRGDKAKAKKLMQRVIDEYGASGSSAPQLAKQFIDENLRK